MKKKLTVLTGIFLMLSVHLYAQTHVWTGNGGTTDWFTPANWNINAVPGSASDVVISSGFEVSIFNGNALASTITLTQNAILNINGSLGLSNLLSIDDTSAVLFSGGTISGGTIENNGTLLFQTLDLKNLTNLTINNHDQLTVSGTNQTQLDTVVINNDPGAEIDIASVGGFLSQGASPSVLNNNGLLKKSPDGTNPIGNFYLILHLNNTGIIEIPEGEILLSLGGNIELNNLETGIIRGEGTFDITSIFVNTGNVSPASDSISGTLHITNNFDITPPGFLSIDITTLTEYDKIEVVGSPSMTGDIFVQCFTELEIGDEFTIITASNGIISCDFPQFVYADFLASSYEFEVICNPNSVVLRLNNEILGIDDQPGALEITLHPNPVSDELVIQFPQLKYEEFDVIDIVLMDVTGSVVLTEEMTASTHILETNALSSGMYFMILTSEGSRLGASKLVKN